MVRNVSVKEPRAAPARPGGQDPSGTPLHVVHVFPNFGAGGAQMRTIALIHHLGRAFRHTILAIDDFLGAASRLDESRADVRFERAERGRWGPLYPLYLGGKIKRMRPDVVLAYNWGSIDAVVGCTLRGVGPRVQVMDGVQNEELEVELRRRVLARRAFYSRCDRLVAVSRDLERLAVESWRIPRDKVVHLPNGIDTARFRPGDGAPARAALGLPDAPLVGCVANVRPEKNHEAMVDAFACVAQRHPDAHVVFVGKTAPERAAPSAEDRGAWDRIQAGLDERGLRGRVHFTGQIADPLPYYRALDVFLLASRVEQMPLSVVEAMACGKPVLSTDVGDVKWMVSEPNRAFVLSDPEAYADALDRLLGDADLRARLGTANRARAEEVFDLRRMADRFAALCRGLARREEGA